MARTRASTRSSASSPATRPTRSTRPTSRWPTAAGELAVNLLQGKDVKSIASSTIDSDTDKGIPAKLLEPKVVNKANVQSTVIADGLYKVADICTGDYAAACATAGLK